jgi:hypothetical protein
MSDTVSTKFVRNGPTKAVVVLTNASDGTGESAAVKVDKSTLVNANGGEPSRLSIRKVQWSIAGFSAVRLYWDHTTPETALVLSYAGELCFEHAGGLTDSGGAGGTGDLLLTATPAAAAPYGGYTIVLHLAK